MFWSMIGVNSFDGILGEFNFSRPGIIVAALKRGESDLTGAEIIAPGISLLFSKSDFKLYWPGPGPAIADLLLSLRYILFKRLK